MAKKEPKLPLKYADGKSSKNIEISKFMTNYYIQY